METAIDTAQEVRKETSKLTQLILLTVVLDLEFDLHTHKSHMLRPGRIRPELEHTFDGSVDGHCLLKANSTPAANQSKDPRQR